MTQHWNLLDTGAASAADNMALDQKLLDSYAAGQNQQPILHLYEWNQPSLTYGYFMHPPDHLNLAELQKSGIDTARRPTGGGITLHLTDFAFSLLVPATHPAYSVNTLSNYAFVNKKVIEALGSLFPQAKQCSLLPDSVPAKGLHAQHHCLAQATKYDIMLEGKKVGGAAQRRTRHAFLHQGTIALALPDAALLQKILVSSGEVVHAMQQNSCPLLGTAPSSKELAEARSQLKPRLCTFFGPIFGEMHHTAK
jgi:lipoate-protein ligase A